MKPIQVLLAGAIVAGFMQTAGAQAPPPPPPPDPNAPVYVTGYLDVAPPQKNAAMALLRQWRTACAKENGNQRCEVLQRLERQHQFTILEVWKDQQSFQAHARAASTTQFRDKLKPMLQSPYDERLQTALSVLPPLPAPPGRVVYVVTHVDVIPPRTAETVTLLKAMAETGRKDPGNLRLEVQQFYAPRLNHFTVVEIWNNKKAFETHQMRGAMIQFREKLQPMLGALYDERLYKVLD